MKFIRRVRVFWVGASFLSVNFALKVEAIEYFPDFKFNEGANNTAEGGITWYLSQALLTKCCRISRISPKICGVRL